MPSLRTSLVGREFAGPSIRDLSPGSQTHLVASRRDRPHRIAAPREVVLIPCKNSSAGVRGVGKGGGAMSQAEIDTVARTVWAEARGEGVAGMTAVACVIMNRARIASQYKQDHGRPHPLFGDGTLASCCTHPWQFSCWNENDPNRQKLLNADDS